jgi:hypothetical protein
MAAGDMSGIRRLLVTVEAQFFEVELILRKDVDPCDQIRVQIHVALVQFRQARTPL